MRNEQNADFSEFYKAYHCIFASQHIVSQCIIASSMIIFMCCSLPVYDSIQDGNINYSQLNEVSVNVIFHLVSHNLTA